MTYARKTFALASGYKLYPEEWDNETNRLKSIAHSSYRADYLIKVDDYVNSVLNFLNDIRLKNEESFYDGSFSLDKIKNELRIRVSGKVLLMDFTKSLAEELTPEGRTRTVRAYFTTAKAFVQFMGTEDIYPDDITGANMERYERYMKSRNLQPNTISFYFRNLRALYNRAVEAKLIRPRHLPPFQNVFTGISRTEKRALATEEMRKVWNAYKKAVRQDENGYKSNNESLKYKQTREAVVLFAFSFLAQGMSFVDAINLKKINLKDNVITYYRQKTRRAVSVKVSPLMKQIIDEFVPLVTDSPYLFPVIAPEKGNEYKQYESALRKQNRLLRSIGLNLGLKRPLTTYVARHSWASIARQGDVPLSAISEALGHKDEKTTEIYLASIERKMLEEACNKVAMIVCGKDAD
jgi:integrase